jgi:hypothetical protein
MGKIKNLRGGGVEGGTRKVEKQKLRRWEDEKVSKSKTAGW